MEIKDRLNKPYTEKQRCDFIVKNNHNLGYEIEETDESLLAIYNEPLPPSDEEIRNLRAQAYLTEIDPITAHISRLRDEEQTEEIITEISALIEERALKVEEIKQRYPYPEGKNEPDSID
jgi:hypothetical protein